MWHRIRRRGMRRIEGGRFSREMRMCHIYFNILIVSSATYIEINKYIYIYIHKKCNGREFLTTIVKEITKYTV